MQTSWTDRNLRPRYSCLPETMSLSEIASNSRKNRTQTFVSDVDLLVRRQLADDKLSNADRP